MLFRSIAVDWFKNHLNRTIGEIENHFEKFRLSEALMTIYKLIWDDFCSWYLEIIKPAYQQPIDRTTYEATKHFFEELIKLLHPFMPFITEEIWHILAEREAEDCIIVTPMPQKAAYDTALLDSFETTKTIIMNVRTVRNEKNIPLKEPLKLMVKADKGTHSFFDEIIVKLCNLSELSFVSVQPEGASSFIAGTTEFYVPLSENINKEEELQRLSAELTYTEGFLVSVTKKLSNEKFVGGAPAQVVETEKKKQADAEKRIKLLKEQIALLGK